MEVIRVKEVSKEYDSKEALKGVSLSVDNGEVFGIMGPNGSGKTTLLKLVDLLEEPSRGRIVIYGSDTHQTEDERVKLRRRMALVFQQPANLNASVSENAAYPLKLRKWSPREIERRVRQTLETVGLINLANQHAATLSGGEAQRLALARAIAYSPEILLLDEPTANLDPANIKIIENTITKLNQENGTTVILVTHNVFQARRLCKRTAFILDGELVESGTAPQVLTSPQDPRTRAFISGEMAF